MITPRRQSLAILLLCILAATYCGGAKSPTAPTSPAVSAVTVTGTPPAVGSTSQFTATATATGGATQDVTSQAVWQSSNPAVATVSGGLVTAVAAGTAEITALYQQVTGRSSISVVAVACTFEVSPGNIAIPMEGGTGTVNVSVTQGTNCNWTFASNSPFATITGGASGSGNGSVTFTVSANPSGSRTGSLTVAGQTVTITQAQGACVYAVSPTSIVIPPAGGTTTITVTVQQGTGCSWTSVNNLWFSTITGSSSGTGSGSVTVTVPANTGVGRVDSLVVAGQGITITQGGVCVSSVSTTMISMPAAGGTATITVTEMQGNNCSWTSVSNTSFAVITAGATGAGSGNVTVAVAPNTGYYRTGWVMVAGHGVLIAQESPICINSLSPTSRTFTAVGGTGTVTVAAPSSCSWSVENTSSFVVVTEGASGVGSGTITYTVAPNTTQSARQSTILVGGKPVEVLQEAPYSASMSLVSDVGDYIGAGQTLSYSAPSSTFTLTVDDQRNHVTVLVVGSDGLQTHRWTLDLAAPQNRQLVAGTYELATRYPFQAPTVPGLSFYGNGRGCNVLSGRFVVLEATYGAPGTVVTFRATFEQHCEGIVPALRGEISFAR